MSTCGCDRKGNTEREQQQRRSIVTKTSIHSGEGLAARIELSYNHRFAWAKTRLLFRRIQILLGLRLSLILSTQCGKGKSEIKALISTNG